MHGSPLDLTPNFDRLARAGTDVHYAVTCQPVCGPARSCLQTGLYATTTGYFCNGIALHQPMARQQRRSLELVRPSAAAKSVYTITTSH